MSPLLLSTLVAVLPSAPVEAPTPLGVVIRRHAEHFIAGKPHLAVVIGVSTPAGRQVWGFGGIDRDGRRVPPDGRTLYEIGSITKTFTGTVLADLVRDGTVALDDPVREYLPPDWSVPTRDGREVSLLHLTTHTSSLPRMPPGFLPLLVLTGSGEDPYAGYKRDNLRLTLWQLELSRPIGSRFEYSNLGVGLLGDALARAAGEPDAEPLFQKRLLTPLGLTDTAFTLTEEQLARLAPPFRANGWRAHNWHFDCLKACGGLRSTADDLLTYAEAALGRAETPLRPAFELATQPWRQTCEGERSVGLGWFVQPIRDPDQSSAAPGRLIWHGGATGGYRTFLGLLPERGCAVVILSNSAADVDPALVTPLVRGLMREYPRR